MNTRLVRLAALGVFLVGCGSSTAPHNSSGGPVSFVGVNQTDSIGTQLPQALVVGVRGPGGQSSAGHIVEFVSVLDSAGTAYEAYVGSLSSQSPTTFLSDTLDASGHASAVITLGSKSGTAIVLVKVPDFGYVDTAKFTVTPGHTVGVALTPVDTTVIEGSAITLKASTVDRFGNSTSQSVQLAVSGPGTLAGQTLTATGIGQITVVATSGALASDTAQVSSVPAGTLAASLGNGIAIFNFDGSGMRRITINQVVGNVRWAPSGNSLAFDNNTNGCTGYSNTLWGTDLQGNVTALNTNTRYDMYPSYSPDGTWLYFTANTGYVAALWRMHPDGSNADSLNTLDPDFDLYPSVSPDGTQLVYGVILPSLVSSDIRELTISTGAVTDLHIAGWAPSWAPAGNHIAYLVSYTCQGHIAVMNTDGSGSHVLTSDSYQGEFDWSPDGQWIVAYNVTRNLIDLINASTGVRLPLTFTGGMSSPSWLRSSTPAQRVVPRVTPRASRR